MCLLQVRAKMCPKKKLHEKSRINYGKIYTIEFYNKVEHVGDVAKDEVEILLRQFSQVQRLSEASSLQKVLDRIEENSCATAPYV